MPNIIAYLKDHFVKPTVLRGPLKWSVTIQVYLNDVCARRRSTRVADNEDRASDRRHGASLIDSSQQHAAWPRALRN